MSKELWSSIIINNLQHLLIVIEILFSSSSINQVFENEARSLFSEILCLKNELSVKK
jgi:hypothetical protein